MVLSCLPVSLYRNIIGDTMSVRDWSLAAAEMGLDAFDISILFVRDRTQAALKQLRTQLQAGGLPVSMMTIYSDFTDPDSVNREHKLESAISDIALAAELNVGYVRITAGQYYPESKNTDSLDYIYECFCKCLDKAQCYGVKLLWENHSKPGIWERQDFNYNIERFLLMFDRLKSLPIGINFDIANAYALGCLPELMSLCFNGIRSVHINDVLSVSPLNFCGIGEGKVPIYITLEELLKRNYDGIFSIEESGMKGIEGIRCSIERTRKMLADASNV